jgi:hypothetical protein
MTRMPGPPQTVAEYLDTLHRDQLVALVVALQGMMRTQTETIEELAEQRNAAWLLNELCHY